MKKKALTLTEMLVALAITALLMAAAFRAISAVSRSGDVMEQRDDASSLKTGLSNLLSIDIHHADRYRVAEDGFTLDVRSSLKDKNFELGHIPSVVTYSVKRIGSRNWLIRTQQGKSNYSELVCADVSQIVLTKMMDELPAIEELFAFEDWQEMPEISLIVVKFEDSTEDLKLTWCLR